jgi:hypothetical protein
LANLASGAISVGQGDWKDAAVSGIAAIPVVGVIGEIGKGAKVAKDAEEAVSVYKIAKEGETTYVGITNNIARRSAEHGADLKEVAGGLTRNQARGVEQALIEHHGLASNGGTLTNKINSISRANTIYHEAVTFGRMFLQSIHYP